MDNRMLGLSSAEAKMKRGESKGGHAPFGTRLCKAKCSVLYPLSVRLRKIVVCESGVKATADGKELGFCVGVNLRNKALLFAERGYIKNAN